MTGARRKPSSLMSVMRTYLSVVGGDASYKLIPGTDRLKEIKYQLFPARPASACCLLETQAVLSCDCN